MSDFNDEDREKARFAYDMEMTRIVGGVLVIAGYVIYQLYSWLLT